MKVLGSSDIRSELAGIGRFYTDIELPEIGERKVTAIFAAIRNLRTRRIGHRADNNLPADYRRLNVEDYAIFYRIMTDYVLVYEVRHARRKPLKPATHRRLVSKAKQYNFEI